MSCFKVELKNFKKNSSCFCLTLKKNIDNCLIDNGCEITNLFFCLFAVWIFVLVLMMQDATYFCCYLKFNVFDEFRGPDPLSLRLWTTEIFVGIDL